MYHAVATEVDAEFIELQNISPTEIIDLTQVAFTEGIDFVFPTGTTLAPGERIVITGNDFQNSTRLANGGEQIVLSAADGQVIRDFNYDDQSPWPESADGSGFSLVLIDPESNPDHGVPQNWRRSAAVGGSPGASDAVEFVGDPSADDDRDGLPALLEHLFGSSDAMTTGSPVHIDLAQEGDLLISFPRDAGADDISVVIEKSSDLARWALAVSELVSVGSEAIPVETWRIAAPEAENLRFLRIRAVTIPAP